MNCGKPVPDGAKFCMHCGTPIGQLPTENSENAIVEKNEQPVQVQQESTEFDRQALNLYLERVNQLEAVYYDLNQKYKHEKEKNNVVRITEVRKKYYSEEFSKISNWCDFGFFYSSNSFLPTLIPASLHGVILLENQL